jgi:hypothetical protein
MKKFILITLVMAAASAGLFAQNANANYAAGAPSANPNVEARAKNATDHLNSLVNLTQEQYNQVLQLNRNFFSRPEASGSGRPAARANAGRQQQLKTILNGDQWQSYQNARQQGQAF